MDDGNAPKPIVRFWTGIILLSPPPPPPLLFFLSLGAGGIEIRMANQNPLSFKKFNVRVWKNLPFPPSLPLCSNAADGIKRFGVEPLPKGN